MKRKGTKTTEFWITIVSVIGVTVLLLHGDITQEQWTTVMAVIVPGYSLSRGISKVGGE